MFPERIERDAIVLERLARPHVDAFELYELFGEDIERARGVFEYVPQEPYATVKDAHDLLTAAETEWDDRERAWYAVHEADGTLAGVAILDLEWDRRLASLAGLLGRPYWGNGYAGTCAHVLLELAFDRLELAVVTMGYDEGNERSEALIERLVDEFGGQYDGARRNATERDGELVDAYDYSVTREQYRAATGA